MDLVLIKATKQKSAVNAEIEQKHREKLRKEHIKQYEEYLKKAKETGQEDVKNTDDIDDDDFNKLIYSEEELKEYNLLSEEDLALKRSEGLEKALESIVDYLDDSDDSDDSGDSDKGTKDTEETDESPPPFLNLPPPPSHPDFDNFGLFTKQDE